MSPPIRRNVESERKARMSLYSGEVTVVMDMSFVSFFAFIEAVVLVTKIPETTANQVLEVMG